MNQNMTNLKIKFEANQEHQKIAIDSVVNLFEGLSKYETNFQLGDEIKANLHPYETIEEDFILDNLINVQKQNSLSTSLKLDIEEGQLLIGTNSWRYPQFTIEMETGTGKTYSYLRTIFELNNAYGFKKYIVVVPSVAIYQGVIKTFEMTKEHFGTIYGNENIELIKYDGQQIGKVKDFATSSFIQLMVMTLDSFNKESNIIYKSTEKIMGQKKPYEYIQETRPILILDESQNYLSNISKTALRNLKPLFSLSYSATPKEKPNLIYRLSPVQAFRRDLVKKIEVLGAEEQDTSGNSTLLVLDSIEFLKKKLVANVKVRIKENDTFKTKIIQIKDEDDLAKKTHNESYLGYIVTEINKVENFVLFKNEVKITKADEYKLDVSRKELFKTQIMETVKTHMELQENLKRLNIKVLSLFFIDKVDNYVKKDGLIKKLFDESFYKLKENYPFFEDLSSEEVRSGYFASRKNKSGENEAIDTAVENEKKTSDDKKIEKEAYDLIMKNKEKLLSFDEKTCFIFSHSALKEGWDNPNVFQICTLNNSNSEIKKRQEIGRGLRLCVNQDGERVIEDGVNILTVIANESYEEYAEGLQNEYVESGDAEIPPKVSNARREGVQRNNDIFNSSDFQNFWFNLCKKTKYKININTEEVIKKSIELINKEEMPESQIVITRGKFIITEISISLLNVFNNRALINVSFTGTDGSSFSKDLDVFEKTDLVKEFKDERLKGFKVSKYGISEEPYLEFENNSKITKFKNIVFSSEKGQQIDPHSVSKKKTNYPVFNIIDKAVKEVSLTRKTVLAIFKGLSNEKKNYVFRNPEGFCTVFINKIKSLLSDQIAESIEYVLDDGIDELYNKQIFPESTKFPQKELIPADSKSLYNFIQIDSKIEENFVNAQLKNDSNMVLYFKFPNLFKINLPKIIGNYNPDWGIVRLGKDGNLKVQLVRETKGNSDPNKLRFDNEKRKLLCAKEHFKALNIDYKQIKGDEPDIWGDNLILNSLESN